MDYAPRIIAHCSLVGMGEKCRLVVMHASALATRTNTSSAHFAGVRIVLAGQLPSAMRTARITAARIPQHASRCNLSEKGDFTRPYVGQ